MIASKEYIDILVTGLSNKTGVTITEGENWHVDIEKKVLTYNKNSLVNLPFPIVRGLLLHELGHILFTSPIADNTQGVKKYGIKTITDTINIMEDTRIEGKLSVQFGSYAENSLALVDLWGIENMLFEHGGDFTRFPKFNQFLIIMLMAYYANHYYLIERLVGHGAEYVWDTRFKNQLHIRTFFDPEVTETYQKYYHSIRNIRNNIRYADDTGVVQNIVELELMPIIEHLLDNNEDENQSNAGENQPDNDEKQPSNDKDDSDDDNGDDDNDDGEDDKNQNNKEPDGGDGTTHGKDDSPSEHTPDMRIVKPAGGGQTPSKEVDNMIQEIGLERPTEQEVLALYHSLIYTTAQKLMDVLKDKDITRFTGNYKSGRLLSRNAYKVTIPNTDRLFSKKIQPNVPMYETHIILDSSGSMSEHNKYPYTFMGAVVLKAIAKKLNFPVHLYHFNIHGYKLNNIDDYTVWNERTLDERGLQLAYSVMEKSDRDTEKLVFVITDGATMRQEFDTIRKNIEQVNGKIFGVGIKLYEREEIEFKNNYEHAVLVPDIETLPSKLITILRSVIHR